MRKIVLKPYHQRYLLLLVAIVCLSSWAVMRTTSTSNTGPTQSHSHNLTLPSPVPLTTVDAATQQRISNNYGKLPLSFEANQGQTDSQVRFISRPAGYRLFLTDNEMVMAVKAPSNNTADNTVPDNTRVTNEAILRMQLIGANKSPIISGIDEQPGKSNYYRGNDAAQWLRDVPTFAKVNYQEVYPGVDLVFYGNQQQLEYDFIVAPGARPADISLAFPNIEKLALDQNGDLLLQVGDVTVRQHKPIIYQQNNGQRELVAGNYLLDEKHNQVNFQIGNYDHSRELIIDPVLSYSTYLGGSGNDIAYGIKVDAAGNAYIVGSTLSTNFPTSNAYQPNCRGCASGLTDAFITKLSPTGTTLLFSTFLGGAQLNEALAIALDSNGNAFITGRTQAGDFPITSGAFSNTKAFGADAFVAKLTPSGNLVMSSFLGGNGNEFGTAIGVDGDGNAWIAGFTDANNFPTTATALISSKTSFAQVGFISKFNPTAGALLYSSYLDINSQSRAQALTVDANGNAYVGGFVNSNSMPTTPGAFLSIPNGSSVGFIMKFAANGALVYSTYLGLGADEITGLAVDADSNVYATGKTSSGNFPTTAGAYQRTNGAFGVAISFIAKLNAAGSQLIYSTYIGGSSGALANAIAINSQGEAYIAGQTTGNTFPVTAGSLATAGLAEGFVLKLSADGSQVLAATYLAGERADNVRAIAVDSNNNLYLAGETFSTSFPTQNPRQTAQTNNGANSDAFVTKLKFVGGQFDFSQPAYTISENKTAVTLTVTRSQGSDGLCSVDYQTEDATAANPTHFQAVSGKLYFDAGQTSKTFTVPIINDNNKDCDKSFRVKLTNSTNGAVLGTQATATITILEDDGQ